MEITRSRELTVRMAEYENYKFSARIVATHHDLGITDEELASGRHTSTAAQSLQDFVAEQLDKALEQDIQDAVDMTTDRKSFLRRAFASTPTTDKDK